MAAYRVGPIHQDPETRCRQGIIGETMLGALARTSLRAAAETQLRLTANQTSPDRTRPCSPAIGHCGPEVASGCKHLPRRTTVQTSSRRWSTLDRQRERPSEFNRVRHGVVRRLRSLGRAGTGSCRGVQSRKYPPELRERAVRVVAEIRTEHESERAADLVARQLAPTAPDRLWVAGITYVSTWSGGCTRRS